MERAIRNGMFPKTVFRYVYRCHPVATGILSDLFYDGQLQCRVSEDQRNEFMTRRSDFWPNSSFSICVVNNTARSQHIGTSSINKPEMNLVVQLVASLTKPCNSYKLKASDIGVISFYSAQTNILTEALRGSGVKCGTVDAFQGSEREVVVLCCTNEQLSEFMQLSNRLNVAMSRARQATIIVGNVKMLKKAKYWNTIVNLVEKNGCVKTIIVDSDEEEYLPILQKKPNPKRTRKARRERLESRAMVSENDENKENSEPELTKGRIRALKKRGIRVKK